MRGVTPKDFISMLIKYPRRGSERSLIGPITYYVDAK